MPHRKVRDKKRYPDSPEAAARRRQKEMERMSARYEGDPDAETCRICGVRRSAAGMPTHMRQEHKTFMFVCECGEGFNIERRYEEHLAASAASHGERGQRDARYKFVDKIARLPYREFIEEMRKPWDKSST